MSPSLVSRARHLAHHAYVATVLALAILVLEHNGWLNWLDSISLRTALAVKDVHGLALPYPKDEASTGLPLVFVVADKTFETDFRQETPLDRRVLRRELERIAAYKPARLVLDLDLSPGPAGAPSMAGQVELDALLVELVQNQSIEVITATPFPAANEELLKDKFEWMAKLCKGGVRFGFSDIYLSQGLALRYAPSIPSLAVVAYGESRTHGAEPQAAPCELVRKGPEKAAFLSTAFSPEIQFASPTFREQLPLDSVALRSIAAKQIKSDQVDSDLPVTGRTVFLGSSYDPRDAFLTIYGPQPGVVLHAATYATMRSPPTQVSHVVAFVFDVLLGVVAAALFGWSWRHYNESSASLAVGHGKVFRPYALTRLWLGINFLLLIGWLLMLFSWSAVLLRLHLWSNPGAMVIGVFVKSLLASRSSVPVALPHNNHTGTGEVMLLDLILLSPVLVYGLWILFFSH